MGEFNFLLRLILYRLLLIAACLLLYFLILFRNSVPYQGLKSLRLQKVFILVVAYKFIVNHLSRLIKRLKMKNPLLPYRHLCRISRRFQTKLGYCIFLSRR